MSPTTQLNKIPEGRRRVAIERVSPEVNGGLYPIKRTVEEEVTVEADIFADGHDQVSALLKFRTGDATCWREIPMRLIENDRWRGSFVVTELGKYAFTVEAWIDHFKSWRRDLEKKLKAGQEVEVELLTGAKLFAEAAGRAEGAAAIHLEEASRRLAESVAAKRAERIEVGLDEDLALLMNRYPDRRFSTVYPKELQVWVDPTLARFGAWYELFPRSCAAEPGRHGTLADCARQLPRIAQMGFDVVYFAPIHPIGRTFRKGKNNLAEAGPDDPGSPWGIGGEEGGHKAIHPQLGTLDDFRQLVRRAAELKLQIALDIAFQCSPDHPYVREHPEWFVRRPDGSIQYAENPPKKYQDIYPLNFESEGWRELWIELRSIFVFWIEQGVKIFRVDNPHTKALPFWEWVIGELKAAYPELIFLSEAFTRPKLMYALAKLGFTQSYNYFPWRNTKPELTQFMTELTRTEVREFYRPNLWPNTPDILTQYLQMGGKPAFMVRLILAATLGASYGIYGPPFELCLKEPREWGSEEYLDSEKYEIKHWDLDAPGNLSELIKKVNRIRRENPALQRNDTLRFHPMDNDQIIAYSKTLPGAEEAILVMVNLDPHHAQSGWTHLIMEELGLTAHDSFQMHELLTGARYLWAGPRNFIELNPEFVPAHIFRVRRRVRSERDFDYYL